MPFDRQRASGPPPSMHKPSGTIDVIGTRRPIMEFQETEHKPDLYATVFLLSIIALVS